MMKNKEKKESAGYEEYADPKSSAACGSSGCDTCDTGGEPDACQSGGNGGGPVSPGGGYTEEGRGDKEKAEGNPAEGNAGKEQEGHCRGAKDPAFAELEQKLEEAAGKRDEYLSLAQRVQADFENYKRRNKNATADAYNAAKADVVEAFLPVLDNLERAMDSVPDSGESESVRKGVEMVRRQFTDTLTKLGVEEIEALGKPFDPVFHNAVGQVDGQEGQEENDIAEVLQKGYKIGDKVIRYSMVHVVR